MSNPFDASAPLLLGLKACDTCRKARKARPDASFIDVRETPLSAAQIDWLLSQLGAAAINRASTTWRGLSEAEKQMPEAALLAQHPAVMKRPVLIESDKAVLFR